MSLNTYGRRSSGVQIIDLHGLSYLEAENEVEKFVTDNFNSLPIKIITGDSPKMKNIVLNCTKRYDLYCQKEFWTNYGCFLVTDQQI